MSLSSLSFLTLSIVFVAAAKLSAAPQWRSHVFLVANACFFALLFSSPLAAAPLAIFIAIGYFAYHDILARSSVLRTTLWVSLIVFLFIWLRRYSLLEGTPALPFPYVVVGISYMLFRIIHLLIDAGDGALTEKIRPVAYFNYICNFLTLTSGPITRYQEHEAQWTRPQLLTADDGRDAITRIVIGYFRIFVVAAIGEYVFSKVKTLLLADATASPLQDVFLFATACGLYAIYLYHNFAGSMDIVIGIAKLVGVRLPENFNRPFSARNMIDFWNRWHMTLSNWFKQYLFNPLLAFLMMRSPSAKAAPWLGVIVYFAVFTTMGAWHGATGVFILFGVALGTSVAINKIWQIALAERLGKKRYKAMTESAAYAAASQALTIGYFAVALCAFWVTEEELAILLERVTLAGVAGAIAAVGAAWVVINHASAFVENRARAAAQSQNLRPVGIWVRYAGLATLSLTCIWFQAILNRPPEFVYAAF